MSVGERIRAVRKDRKLKQTEMAELGGVTRFAQGKFESGENLPGTAYLLGLHAAGVDVAYILTGSPGAMDLIEAELLRRFRDASSDVQGAVLRALAIPFAHRTAPAVLARTAKNIGQVVGGKVSQRQVTFNVGGKKKGPRG